VLIFYFAKMDKCLRPQVFSAEADTADGARRWQYWKRMLENYLRRIDNISAQDKLDVLISLLDASVYTYIRERASYQEAIDCLENIYVKPVNEVYARHKLNTCRQKSEEYRLSANSISVLSVDSAAACNTSEENSVSNSGVRRKFSWGGFHSVADSGHLFLMCAVCDVTI